MKNKLLIVFGGLVIVYTVLLFPDKREVKIESASTKSPFIWDQDEKWNELEEVFSRSSELSENELDNSIDSLLSVMDKYRSGLNTKEITPQSPELDLLLNTFFELSPLVATRQQYIDTLLALYTNDRIMVKHASINWDMDQRKSRDAIYRLSYGMRAASEEVLLQLDREIDPVLMVEEMSSQTPSVEILGIKVHSGDLLVSRGGAEVSALISRGNDYPGNFSHVALIYIDEDTNIPYLIEAHIERGVAVASLEEYIADRKLRFMVLRPRADLQEMIEDPMLPHRSAKLMFEEVQKRHIPYDFKMNFNDPEAMFCSEVGSYAYRKNGIELWQAESTISSNGVVSLLNTFGVQNFVTQMPSDLEYDPQLAVVGEWRNNEALFDDHLYNAVIDAMIACAEQGEEVEHQPFMLPVARAIKGYSLLMNTFESEGPIPEGMNATQALKNNTFVDTHVRIKNEVIQKADHFEEEMGYTPPYWELIRMAEESSGCLSNN